MGREEGMEKLGGGNSALVVGGYTPVQQHTVNTVRWLNVVYFTT